jgi:hypothetical protein
MGDAESQPERYPVVEPGASESPRNGSTTVRRAACLVVLTLFSPIACWAYRPFEGTDADVAGLHEVEIEMGPIGYLEQGNQRYLTDPLLVLNYGVVPGTELVAQGEVLHTLPSDAPGPSVRFVSPELSVKHVLRDGVLQGATGPSIATEVAVLPPEIHGDNGFGTSVAGILSYRWDFATVHANSAIGTTRTHHLDLFQGVILEGPARWTVRPVTEWYFERTEPGSHTLSKLIGAIWQHSEQLAFDFGLRSALVGHQREHEIIAGFSWGFELGGEK